jgi:hypothetical protein
MIYGNRPTVLVIMILIKKQALSVFFDSTLYSQLQNPVPIDNADWDVLVMQPDPLLFADAGVYDALALVNSPSLADSFSVDFIWLGEGVPSIQNFEIYDANFEVTASGNTVSTVPLPASLWLFLSGLWLLIKPRVVGFTGFFNKEAVA